MIPFENRIKKENDFKKILKNGKLLHSNIFTIKFLENDLDRTRFGFIVSRKISLKAVLRNRIKRILREQIRLCLPRIKKGLDIVVIAKKDIVGEKSEKIGFVFEKLFLEERFLLKNKK